MPTRTNKGWLTARVECRVCSNEHVAVYPASISDHDETHIECSKCSSCSCHPTHYVKPGGELVAVQEPDEGDSWKNA